MKERVDFKLIVEEKVAVAESNFIREIERHSGDERRKSRSVTSVNRWRKEQSFELRWYRVCLFTRPCIYTGASFCCESLRLAPPE